MSDEKQPTQPESPCQMCNDTGYEPALYGGEPMYCTYCRKGCAIALAAIRAQEPDEDDVGDYDERDPMLESFGDFHE